VFPLPVLTIEPTRVSVLVSIGVAVVARFTANNTSWVVSVLLAPWPDT
jgi:hypothetical protein